MILAQVIRLPFNFTTEAQHAILALTELLIYDPSER